MGSDSRLEHLIGVLADGVVGEANATMRALLHVDGRVTKLVKHPAAQQFLSGFHRPGFGHVAVDGHFPQANFADQRKGVRLALFLRELFVGHRQAILASVTPLTEQGA